MLGAEVLPRFPLELANTFLPFVWDTANEQQNRVEENKSTVKKKVLMHLNSK